MTARLPPPPPTWPVWGNAVSRALGRLGLACLGWRMEGRLPEQNRLVIIVAPHTSNRDFFVGLFALLGLGVRVHWLGKHSIFRWPLGPLLRALGGVAVTRHAATDVVDQAALSFGRSGPWLLALSPEGTRRHLGRLKTGFLRIARAADVPVLPIGLDYADRRLVIGEPFRPDRDIAAEERRCYAYFQRFAGRHPDQY